MGVDKRKYLKQFVEESLENIYLAESLLFEIRSDSGVKEDNFVTLLRALHTVKGAARILEFKPIESLVHSLETAFIALKEERFSLNDIGVKLILAAIDELKIGIEKLLKTGKVKINAEAFQKELFALCANEDFTIPSDEEIKKKAKIKYPDRKTVGSRQGKTDEAKADSIRISLTRIDEIIRNIAALQTIEITARNISRETDAINIFSRKFSRLISASQSQNLNLLHEYRTMELMVNRLSSLVKNYSIDTGNYIHNAYNSIISLRMLPLSTVLDAYPRFVFSMSTELGKKVKINIVGSENEIDKNLIECLSQVFLHMIRNSIDHGIETPAERVAIGKNETGLITICCMRESGNMKVTISDDGRGINIEAIRRKIVNEGLTAKDDAAVLSDEELINYIFQSGFSTAEKLTNVSGRGVGMDAVRSNIEQMKGSIAVQNKTGEGTVFTVSVPLSIASLMGFPVESGGMKFIIPANFVDTVLLIKVKEIITVADRPCIEYKERIIKLFYLHHILKIPEDEKQNGDDSVFAVIIQAYEDTVALVMESMGSMRQVILKTMPSFMEYIEMFSGIVLNEDYEMVPVLHIPTIIKMAKRTKTIDMKKRHIDYERLRKTILVTDDSAPTRDTLRNILESEGYKVDTAADGSQALSLAKNMHYDLICTDLGMPIMDGFMLTENIRKNESLENIPIIVISSMHDIKDQNRASDLGVNRYIIKSSFNNRNLLATVKELIGEANG